MRNTALVIEETLPFTPVEVAAIGSLALALDRLVFNHPNVEALRQRAAGVVGVPFYNNAEYKVAVYGHDGLMLPLSRFRERDYEPIADEEETEVEGTGDADTRLAKLLRGSVWPKEHSLFYKELRRRAEALFGMLKRGELEGVGYTAKNAERETLLMTVWSHDDYYFHAWTGDIYEARPSTMIRRWVGVALQLPVSAAAVALRSAVATVPVVASNVVRIAATRPPKRTGPKPFKLNNVIERMCDDLRADKIALKDLPDMKEKVMAAEYDASRDTCRKAREIVLSKFKYQQIATNDK